MHTQCNIGVQRNLYSGEQSFGLYRGFFPDITTLNCDAVGTKVSGRNRQGGPLFRGGL